MAASACAHVSTDTPYAAIAPLGDERIERVVGRVILDHRRRRAVQLHEIQRVDAEVPREIARSTLGNSRECSSPAAAPSVAPSWWRP